MSVINQNYDLVVVGGGNAALCAAITAAEHGAQV
jgi:tricarballylate dehydrogenase